MENKKRNLEEAVDSLNEECAKLKAAEQMQAVSTIDKAAEQEQALLIKGALEQQLDQHREAHQKQVSRIFAVKTSLIKKYIYLQNCFRWQCCVMRSRTNKQSSRTCAIPNEN